MTSNSSTPAPTKTKSKYDCSFDCRTTAAKIWSNLMIADMPMWAYFMHVCAFHWVREMPSERRYWNMNFDQLTALMFVLGLSGLLSYRLGRLRIKGSRITFPYSLRSCDLKKLKRIAMEAELPGKNTKSSAHILFEFEDESPRRMQLRSILPFKKQLLEALEHKAPEAIMSLKIRDLLTLDELNAIDVNEPCQIHYHKPGRFHELKDALATNENTIQSYWQGAWLLAFATVLPLSVCILQLDLCKVLGPAVQPPAFELTLLDSFSQAHMNLFGDLLAKRMNDCSDLFSSNSGLAILLELIGAALGIWWLGSLYQPNRLKIDSTKLSLLAEHSFIRHEFRTLRWTDVTAVLLHTRGNSSKTITNELHFFTKQSDQVPALKLSLAALRDATAQKAVLQAIEKYAPQATIDPMVVEKFDTNHSQSYTELWLQSLSTPPKRERLTPLMAGQSLRSGAYAIVSELGAGGQGTAYLAVDKFNKHCTAPSDNTKDLHIVLKEFVLPVYVDKEVRRQAIEKFQRESEMLSDLNHSQVVKLLDYFIEDHRAYLVLEHVPGQSLRNYVEARGAMPESQVADLTRQMCEILRYLHELDRPIIHRDFTPDNLMMDESGKLKLIDFDVARKSESAARTAVVGKHAFIPPEQFRGRPGTQSDIYSMGATVFFLLTGEDPEPLTKSVPKNFVSDISPEFDAFVQRATELDAANRFQSAAEALAALDITHVVSIREREQVNMEPLRG